MNWNWRIDWTGQRSSVVRLDDVRRRSHLSCRLPLVRSCCRLRRYGLRWERSPVTDSVAVPELAVLPLLLQ